MVLNVAYLSLQNRYIPMLYAGWTNAGLSRTYPPLENNRLNFNNSSHQSHIPQIGMATRFPQPQASSLTLLITGVCLRTFPFFKPPTTFLSCNRSAIVGLVFFVWATFVAQAFLIVR
jgi:hypothetical protein